MYDKPLQEELLTRCPYLFEQLGMRTVYDDYEPPYFGNSTAILENDIARVKVDRDRGQLMVRGASLRDPDKWHTFLFSLSPVTAVYPSVEDAGEAVRKYIEHQGRETIFFTGNIIPPSGGFIPTWEQGRLL
jgi:hypothetical protein